MAYNKNIVGETPPKFVRDQVNTRQSVLGKSQRTPQDLTWMYSKTSWITLASSVNIANQNISVPKNGETIILNDSGSNFRQKYIGLAGQNYGGNRLAKEFVLQAGTSTVNDSSTINLRSGISQTNNTLPSNQSAYGLGGTEFGLVPMPGITSFALKTYNNGTLREATVEIIAHNDKQFEYIDTLYLRLGYSMFLEWGNTSYPESINSNGDVTYATPSEVAALSLVNDFLSYSSNKQGIDSFNYKISTNRNKSSGNYDGFIGFVKNYTWDFEVDGTYKITLILISAGSVIESLKINPQSENVKYPTTTTTGSDSIRTSALETFIDVATIFDPNKKEGEITYTKSGTAVQTVSTNNPATKTKLTTNEAKAVNMPETVQSGSVLACNIAFGAGSDFSLNVGKAFYYVHFGSLLKFINQNLLSYDIESNPNIIQIDNSLDTYVYSNNWSFPSDPSKFIIQYDKTIPVRGENFKIGIFNDSTIGTINKFHDTVDGVLVGRLMNIYFERDYLKSVIKNNLDPENGSLFLDKFLTTLINDINTGLGSINKIKYRSRLLSFASTSKTTEYIQFYDEVRSFGQTKLLENSNDYSINIFGLNGGKGSFATNYSIRTEIDKRLQTMIAIGAQAGGQSISTDSTAISKWNVGLVDRVNPVKLDLSKISQENAAQYVDYVELRNQYIEFLLKLRGGKISKSFTIERPGAFNSITTSTNGYVIPNLSLLTTEGENPWSSFQTIQSTFFSKALAADALSKETATPFIGFLPIKFSLTLDGISGFRIFDKINIDTKFLPTNYGDTLEFIITSIDHAIVNNKWSTTIQTISIPKLSDEATIPLTSKTLKEATNSVPTSDDETQFYIGPSVWEWKDFKPNGKTQANASIGKILSYFNSSPVIQGKVTAFLEAFKTTYPTGFALYIVSLGRELVNDNAAKGIGAKVSDHTFGTAFDINIFELKNGKLGKVVLNKATANSEWQSFGIVSLANSLGIEWGGTYGNVARDPVHFSFAPDSYLSKEGGGYTKTSIKDIFLKSYNNVKALDKAEAVDKPFVRAVFNSINTKDLFGYVLKDDKYLVVEKFNIPTEYREVPPSNAVYEFSLTSPSYRISPTNCLALQKKLDQNNGLFNPTEEAKIEAALKKANCFVGGFLAQEWLNGSTAAKFIPKGK
jgi:hypothetical protein